VCLQFREKATLISVGSIQVPTYIYYARTSTLRYTVY